MSQQYREPTGQQGDGDSDSVGDGMEGYEQTGAQPGPSNIGMVGIDPATGGAMAAEGPSVPGPAAGPRNRPPVPPINTNIGTPFPTYPYTDPYTGTSYHLPAGYAAGPNPAPAVIPITKNSKSHVAKPDPFRERKDFDKFARSCYLYFAANGHEFPTDQSKILFCLSYMKEGLPGQFAENVIQRQIDRDMKGFPVSYGDIRTFMRNLAETFGDVNKKATAQEMLARSYQGNMTGEAFFQMFDQRVMRAGYEDDHDDYLIQVLRKALNRDVVNMIFTMEDLPDTYERYKKAALKFDKRVEEMKRLKQGNWRDRPNPLPGNKGPNERPRKYEPMEVDNSEIKKKTCFRCGSEDHFIRNCPKPDDRKKKANIREVTTQVDDTGITKENNENGWGNTEDFASAQQ